MKGFKICRIFGIDIKINPSWFIFFGLAVFVLATGFFPRAVPEQPTFIYWAVAIAGALALFASVLFHELAHSLVAKKFKIPVKQITLFILGGAAQIEKKTDAAKQEFLIAIAGPLSSLFLAVVFYVSAIFVWNFSIVIGTLLSYLGIINFALAAFNLLPGYPLDGGRVLKSILWGISKNELKSVKVASIIGQVIACAFIIWGIYSFLVYGLFGGLWFALIGWFLVGAAKAEYRQLTLNSILDGAKVEDVKIFEKDIDRERVCKLEDGLKDMLKKMTETGQDWCYVEKEGKIKGVITISEIKKYIESQKKNK